MVKFKDGDQTKWLYLDEFDGLANFIMLDRDEYDVLVANDFDSDYGEYIEAHFAEEIDGIALSPEYETVYESIYSDDNKNNPAAALIRYLITLVRCEQYCMLDKLILDKKTDREAKRHELIADKVLVIDTYGVYLFDLHHKRINLLYDLSDLKTISNVSELRRIVIGQMT